MRLFKNLSDPELAHCLLNGGVVVLPTDTLYGVLAQAGNAAAVDRVYQLRGRQPQKPFVILVAGVEQITDQRYWTDEHRRLAEKYWPGALSLVAPVSDETPHYLHRGTKTLAYRVPADEQLMALLAKTGPLVAPSANPEGMPPAETMEEAKAYFEGQVDGMVDGGDLSDALPSTVAGVENGKIKVFRQGSLELL